jgi:hypothetical protein
LLLLEPLVRSAFSGEPGSSLSCFTSPTLTGAFLLIANYHEDFETPGISPLKARLRKHNRHSPNLRRYARGRPQILQRLCFRVENFGFLTFCGFVLKSVPSLTRFAVVAKFAPNCVLVYRETVYRETVYAKLCTANFVAPVSYALNGIPRCFNNERA